MSPEAAEALGWTLGVQLDPATGQTLFALLCAILCAAGIYLGRRAP